MYDVITYETASIFSGYGINTDDVIFCVYLQFSMHLIIDSRANTLSVPNAQMLFQSIFDATC